MNQTYYHTIKVPDPYYSSTTYWICVLGDASFSCRSLPQPYRRRKAGHVLVLRAASWRNHQSSSTIITT